MTPTALPMAAEAPPPPPAAAVAAPPEPDPIEALAGRLDGALARRADLDPAGRAVLDDALGALGELHKAGLTAIVRALKADPRGKELLFDLVDEPSVRMVLAMHGIIRGSDPATTARAVLDGLRPGIQGHGGDVALDRIEGSTAFVKLSGACNGCSMAGVTMREGVEKALLEGVPGLTAVEVVPNDPVPAAAPEPVPLLQITGVNGASPAVPSAPPDAAGPGPGWIRTFPLDRVGEGKLEALSLRPDGGETVEVVVVNVGGQLTAYVNACAHQGMPLDNAIVDTENGTLTCPWHGFCFDAASGECLTMPAAQLEQLPLRVDADHIWIRASR